jgi:hypothetical protein
MGIVTLVIKSMEQRATELSGAKQEQTTAKPVASRAAWRNMAISACCPIMNLMCTLLLNHTCIRTGLAAAKLFITLYGLHS